MRINDPTHSFNRQFHRMMKLSEQTRAPEQSRAEHQNCVSSLSCWEWVTRSLGAASPHLPYQQPLPPILPCNPELVKNKCDQQQKVGREKLTCCRPLNHSQHSVHDRSSEQWSAWPIAGRGKFPRINIITLPTIDFPIISWIPPFNISAFPHFSILLFSVSQFCFSSTLLFQHFSILLFQHSAFSAFQHFLNPAFQPFLNYVPDSRGENSDHQNAGS